MSTNRTPKIWITSDLHFSHKNILKFCPDTRTFADVDEMDESIIKELQEKVHPDDTLYMLGDISFTQAVRTRSLLSRIPGKKILIYGNHDQVIIHNVDIQRMFHSIHHYLEITHEGVKFILFHFPIYEWNQMHRGAIHAHGHLHDKKCDVPGKIVNVCWDNHGRILELSELVKMTSHLPVRTHHGD